MFRLFYQLLYVVLLTFSFILISCTETTPRHHAKYEPQTKNIKENIKVKPVNLNQIIMKEAPNEHKNDPLDVVIYGTEWTFSNGEVDSPAKKDILWATTLGNEAVVTVKVPKINESRINIFSLTLNNGKWMIRNMVDVPTFNLDDHIKGLHLPFTKYTVSESHFDHKSSWEITDGQKMIMIAKYPRFTFTPPKETNKININDHEAFVNTMSNGQSLLYYFDQEKLIWIAGNLTKNEIINLAKSLPSATSPYFPGKP
jgi:hypothetical protein